MTELAREYGSGLYALTEEEKISGAVLDEMQALCQIFLSHPDFLRLLSNLSLSKEERAAMLDHAFRGQVHAYLLNFMKILCERGAFSAFYDCEAMFRRLYYQDYGVMEAQLTSAAPLTEEQRKRMLDKLSAMTGKTVVLKEKVDAGLLGGVLLEMDGKQYDNTIRRRLLSIQQAIGGN